MYTIFKNLTIILIAYGEVLWFGSSITSMTMVSFGLMVRSLTSGKACELTALVAGLVVHDRGLG